MILQSSVAPVCIGNKVPLIVVRVIGVIGFVAVIARGPVPSISGLKKKGKWRGLILTVTAL